MGQGAAAAARAAPVAEGVADRAEVGRAPPAPGLGGRQERLE